MEKKDFITKKKLPQKRTKSRGEKSAMRWRGKVNFFKAVGTRGKEKKACLLRKKKDPLTPGLACGKKKRRS